MTPLLLSSNLLSNRKDGILPKLICDRGESVDLEHSVSSQHLSFPHL